MGRLASSSGFRLCSFSFLSSMCAYCFPQLIIIPFFALTEYSVSLGLGLHVDQESLPISRWLLGMWVGELLYYNSLSCVKLSVVLFYLRCFQSDRKYRIVLWLTAFLVVAWCVANVMTTIFACGLPVGTYWETKNGRCINLSAATFATAISNILIDIIILVLPLPILWKLHTDRSRKIATSGVFICGYWYTKATLLWWSHANQGSVVIVSAVRLVIIIQLIQSNPMEDYTCRYTMDHTGLTRAFLPNSIGLSSKLCDDLKWQHWVTSIPETNIISGVYVNPTILMNIEAPIALFTSSMPSVFHLVKRINEKRHARTTNAASGAAYGGNVRPGPLKHLINGRMAKGDPQLSKQGPDQYSMVKLYAGSEDITRIAFAEAGLFHGDTGCGNEIFCQQIHVRRDVDVETSLALK